MVSPARAELPGCLGNDKLDDKSMQLSAISYSADVHLSRLLGRPLFSPTNEGVGKVDDVIVGLRGEDYPVATGLVAKVGGRRVFVPMQRVAELSEERIVLAKSKVDLRGFERRDGEVLLREDILGHRLIDVADAELVRAWDVELRASDEGWVVSCLDTRRPPRLLGLIRTAGGRPCQDWKAFEPLIGHTPSVRARSAFGRVVKLKPAQIADLLEDASHTEGEEILDVVHADPELEADVFEELDPDIANRLFGDKTDEEVADVVAHMRADDAADAVAELPQARRQKVLDLLPVGTRTKVLTLLGFNATSAGGIMGIDFLTAPKDALVDEALRRIRLAENVQPEALITMHAVDDANRLFGTVSVIGLLQADPESRLLDIVDDDPVRVTAAADVVDVTLLMADYNLMTVPVVDDDNQLLGVITVDDILEATIPEDWRRREPPAHPEPAHTDSEPNSTETKHSEPRG
ncbi:MAG TPA: CBS domain-containing protein [Acidimicrobiales bacterium]|jgi:CBS domain-containing protein|nr:CBS domain-containing protein [Acidimicrobiales bacterium]